MLHQKWVLQHPNDLSAQADFAEAYFSIGRFAECIQRIDGLLMSSEVPTRTKTALRAIEIASLLADDKTEEVLGRLEVLVGEVTKQPMEFKLTWSFDGTRHYIDGEYKLSKYRPWLSELFDALASKDRQTMLTALQKVRLQFKA